METSVKKIKVEAEENALLQIAKVRTLEKYVPVCRVFKDVQTAQKSAYLR